MDETMEKRKVELRFPEQIHEQIQFLANFWGVSASEIYREAVSLAMGPMFERVNKVVVAKKLVQQAGKSPNVNPAEEKGAEL